MEKEIDRFSIEERIIEPCIEFIEKRERAKDRTRDYSKYLAEKRIEIDSQIRGGVLILPRITVIVGTKCTLCCKDCFNLMQYYDKPYDLEIEELLKDLKQLFAIVDYCVCISVIGGEPFIYPHLNILLDNLIRNEKVGSIELTTNAIRIPNEKVLKQLGNEKVFVEVSDYGEIDTMAAFIKVMDTYHAKVHLSTNMTWIDAGNCTARNRNWDDLKALYGNCRSARLCKPLFKGKLFSCSRAAYLDDLGYAKNIESLDIYKCDKKAIFSFWLRDYTVACDYCDMTVKEKKIIEPAIQKNGRHFERSSCTIIPRDDYEEIWNANEWYRQQLDNYKKRVSELEQWAAELQKAKDWLEKQYNNYVERGK